MNTGNIIGRLVREIELSYTKANNQIAKGGIAVPDKYKKEKTHFFNFTAFGKTAGTMSKYLKKGSQIGIVYTLNHDTWISKEGEKRSTVSLIINEFTFCGSKSDNQGGQGREQYPQGQQNNHPTTTQNMQTGQNNNQNQVNNNMESPSFEIDDNLDIDGSEIPF